MTNQNWEANEIFTWIQNDEYLHEQAERQWSRTEPTEDNVQTYITDHYSDIHHETFEYNASVKFCDVDWEQLAQDLKDSYYEEEDEEEDLPDFLLEPIELDYESDASCYPVPYDPKQDGTQYAVTLTYDNRSIMLPYRRGSALHGIGPFEDVLTCVLDDYVLVEEYGTGEKLLVHLVTDLGYSLEGAIETKDHLVHEHKLVTYLLGKQMEPLMELFREHGEIKEEWDLIQ